MSEELEELYQIRDNLEAELEQIKCEIELLESGYCNG